MPFELLGQPEVVRVEECDELAACFTQAGVSSGAEPLVLLPNEPESTTTASQFSYVEARNDSSADSMKGRPL